MRECDSRMDVKILWCRIASREGYENSAAHCAQFPKTSRRSLCSHLSPKRFMPSPPFIHLPTAPFISSHRNAINFPSPADTCTSTTKSASLKLNNVARRVPDGAGHHSLRLPPRRPSCTRRHVPSLQVLPRTRRALSLPRSDLRTIQEVEMKYLLMTLMYRPELAKNIRSFETTGECRECIDAQSYLEAKRCQSPQLWTYYDQIQQILEAFPLERYTLGSIFASIWLRSGSITAPDSYHRRYCRSTFVPSNQRRIDPSDGPSLRRIPRYYAQSA